MRVLLDENLPHQLRELFEDNIEVITVNNIFQLHPFGTC